MNRSFTNNITQPSRKAGPNRIYSAAIVPNLRRIRRFSDKGLQGFDNTLVAVSRFGFWTRLACLLFLVQSARSQEATNAPTRLEPAVVTGSYIPTAETVGPVPMEIITAAQIEGTGAEDVRMVLKKLSPSFSGNNNIGPEVNNGGAGESYASIRNLKTLVLINGHRLGESPSSFFINNSGFSDLNTIPVAAIERIEVLKDGASAIYGSDAIGGVINIITREDFSGVEIGGRYGAATGEGSFTEQRVSLVGGGVNSNSSFVVTAQYYHRDALPSSDRKVGSLDQFELTAHNIDPNSIGYYISPSFPGKVSDNTGSYILRSSPLLQPFGLFDAAAAKSPPRIPNGSGGFKTFAGPTAVSDYNSDPFWQTPAGQALGGAPYVANPGVLLNTTDLGTDSMQSQERRNVFASGAHDLFGKQMEIFGDFLYAGLDTEGKLAPAPVIGLGAKQANINIPADNPFNPFGIDLGPIGGTNGLPPNGPRIRSRFWESGNRLLDTDTDYYHFVGGLKGEFDSGWGYNAAYTYNRYNQLAPTRNAINGAALDLALQPSLNPVYAAQGLSQLPGTGPTPVPIYNLFSVPGQNDPATIDAISTTLLATTKSVEWDAGGVVTGTPLNLPAGKLGVAIGGGYTEESLSVDFDPLTRSGQVPGLNAAQPTSGTRRSWAVFAEARIPVTSPEMDIPLLRSLEITAAGRYETFDPGGAAAVPKVGLRWQPLDEQVTLRMGYSQSFVAPATFELFGGDSVTVVGIGVPVTSAPDAAINGLQEYTVDRSNPALKPADAENWSGGIVLSPKAIKGLNLSVDYYHVSTRNDIFRVPAQTMVDDLNAKGSASIWQPYFSKADGSQITTTAVNQANDADWGSLTVPLRNGAAVVTDGLDLTGNYQFDADLAGKFTLYANANLLLSFDYSDPFAGTFHYAGKYSDLNTGDPGGQGTLPDYQITTGFVWDFHDFTYTVNARYVPPVTVASGSSFTVNGKGWTVESWYSIDMQLAYRFGERYGKVLRDTRLAVGVNNVTDNPPPLIASAFEDNTDKSTYDIVGRFIYFEISKKF